VPATSTEPQPALGDLPQPQLRARPRRLAVHAPRRPAIDARRLAWGVALAIAALLCVVTFYAKGGLSLETMTVTEMALTCAAGAAIAAAILLGPRRPRAYGVWSVGLLLAFSALTALSVVWSVQPDESWQDAGRMFAYSGVFAAAVALVRIDPERWAAVIGGVTLAAVVVCGYALLTKIFPGDLVPASRYARLDEPYGYWNAIGLTAALGAICCLWLGARRTGHALLSALAYPAMGLLLLTLLLAYSRGALAALAIGVVLWLIVVPLRLRGAAVLIVGGLAAGGVAAWDFSTHALSAEGVALDDRMTAGHRLGALVVAMLLLLAFAGMAIGFFTGRRAPSARTRRRAGAALLALIVLAFAGFVGALALSHRGLTGSISHAVDALTNPNAKPPSNTADRLTAVASVRARYYKEGIQAWEAHPLLGNGALGYHTARLRYRTVTIDVHHAHGFVVQTLADLGLVGLITALALLCLWMAAAGRPTHPLNRRWTGWRDLRARTIPRWRSVAMPFTAERIGMLTMLCVVVALARRLDLVRARQRLRGVAVRGLAGRTRPARAGWGRAGAPRRSWPRTLTEAGVGAGLPPAAPRPGRTAAPRDRHWGNRARAAFGLVAVAAATLRRRSPAGARAGRVPPERGAGRGPDGGQPRSALGAGAVRALRGPAGGGPTGAGAGDPSACGAAAAVQPRKLGASRALRTSRQPPRRAQGHRSGDLPRPSVGCAAADQRTQRLEQVDRNPECLHPGPARLHTATEPDQKRDRTARASRRRRAPGRPPAPRTSTSWKRKSASSSLRESRV
jgi:hypothetical protein